MMPCLALHDALSNLAQCLAQPCIFEVYVEHLAIISWRSGSEWCAIAGWFSVNSYEGSYEKYTNHLRENNNTRLELISVLVATESQLSGVFGVLQQQVHDLMIIDTRSDLRCCRAGWCLCIRQWCYLLVD